MLVLSWADPYIFCFLLFHNPLGILIIHLYKGKLSWDFAFTACHQSLHGADQSVSLAWCQSQTDPQQALGVDLSGNELDEGLDRDSYLLTNKAHSSLTPFSSLSLPKTTKKQANSGQSTWEEKALPWTWSNTSLTYTGNNRRSSSMTTYVNDVRLCSHYTQISSQGEKL